MLGPFLQQGSVLVPPGPHKSPMQRCAEPGKMGILQSQQMAAASPFAPLPSSHGGTALQGGHGRLQEQSGSAPRRARVPACDEHTVPSHVAAAPRGRKPSFKGREAGGARVSGGGCSPVFVILRKKSESFRSWDNY